MKKIKVMVFAKRSRLYKCSVNGNKIEQTGAFEYLGVVFQSNGSHTAHAEYVAQAAQRSTSALLWGGL